MISVSEPHLQYHIVELVVRLQWRGVHNVDVDLCVALLRATDGLDLQEAATRGVPGLEIDWGSWDVRSVDGGHVGERVVREDGLKDRNGLSILVR